MQCPRLHGTLSSIVLNSDQSSPLYAYLCSECHGVWMRSLECRTFLGLECERLVANSEVAFVDLNCPHCQTNCRLYRHELENGSHIDFHVCPRCASCFFDAVQFSLIVGLQLKAERAISGMLAKSPIDNLGVKCCDCGATVSSLESLYDAGIGYCCQSCHANPPILSENKLQTVQLVTFHDMEIKVDHWQMSTKSRIAITPVEPCLLDVHMFSLSPLQRIVRCGRRKLALHGNLRKHVDATEDMQHVTPWHVFLKQRGVSENLDQLTKLGQFELSFSPHSIVFVLNAKHAGTETKLKFETTVRRLLLAYERFVTLSHRYSFKSADSNDETE